MGLFNYLKQLNKFNLLNNLFSITCINSKDIKFIRFQNIFGTLICLFSQACRTMVLCLSSQLIINVHVTLEK